MFKSKKQLLIVLLVLPLVAFAAAIQDHEFSMRSHYKDKERLSMRVIDPNLLFYKENYRITDGQLWGGVENINNTLILVKASTSKKDYVREWAKAKNKELNGVGWSGDNMIGAMSTDKTPGRLNFAFVADIEISRVLASDIFGSAIKYICPNVIMGQGSYSSGISGKTVNNWWVLSNVGGKNLRCIGPNGKQNTFALVYPDSKDQFPNVINIAFVN